MVCVISGEHQLIPTYQPRTDGSYASPRRKNATEAGTQVSTVTRGRILTQHTGLPPRGKPGRPR